MSWLELEPQSADPLLIPELDILAFSLFSSLGSQDGKDCCSLMDRGETDTFSILHPLNVRTFVLLEL